MRALSAALLLCLLTGSVEGAEADFSNALPTAADALRAAEVLPPPTWTNQLAQSSQPKPRQSTLKPRGRAQGTP